ncbi:short-chain dehydrogenase/reductase family 9C member 7-like [Centruroides sculpturatus]|uniref:short-chain dehydrogenase/reductase family 9C member 7-like n=1 Tax=Centruroides sculpturatus TaxID=218467 RepID=UPI000C6D29B1|nr:short-chain dehydrogenase/reductase family 9C member 7-like [Centruroides sculpturatus]
MLSLLFYIHLIISVLLLYFGYLIYKSYQRRLPSKNKAVFITGCDTGFGHLFAQRMAERNYRVFAGCLFPEGDGANKLKAFSSKIEVIPLDVTNEQSVKEAAKAVEISLRDDDILWAVVNNAGLGHSSEIEWTPMETILKLFNVNVFGMVRVTKEFLPHLQKSGGRIINLTSITGIRRIPSVVCYSMSKSAASSFSDGIRLEMKKWNIKVINIQPYYYSTHLTNSDNITSNIDQCWKNTDSKYTSVLGNEYLKNYTKNICRMANLLNSRKVEDVILCLEDAVTSPFPKLYYRPGNLLNKIFIDIPNLLPPSAQDFIQNLFVYSKIPCGIEICNRIHNVTFETINNVTT